MNKWGYIYTRKKPEYAYIYIWRKKTKHRQHNPDEASIHIGLGVLPIIYRERGENNRKRYRTLVRKSTQKSGVHIYEIRITRK